MSAGIASPWSQKALQNDGMYVTQKQIHTRGKKEEKQNSVVCNFGTQIPHLDFF